VRSCLALVLFGALVAGCSDSSPSEPAAAADTTAETTSTVSPDDRDLQGRSRDIAWLRRLHRWEENLRQDSLTTQKVARDVQRGTRSRLALRRPLVKITRCEKNLMRQAREPSASDYRPGYELLARACRSLKDAALVVIHSIDTKSRPSGEVTRDSVTARKLFRRGTATLEGALRANRPLQVSRGSLDESKVEPRLSGTVSRFVLRRPAGIEVRCWSKREWKFVRKEWGAYVGHGDLLGFVHDARPRISLAPRICKQLARLVYRGERPTSGIPLYRISEAVLTLSHEGEHIRNRLGDEAATECHGMQRMARLARMLGTSRSYGDLLATTFSSKLYDFDLPSYKSSECRDGGALDLRPTSSAWPS
jgi:hypothetical protein